MATRQELSLLRARLALAIKQVVHIDLVVLPRVLLFLELLRGNAKFGVLANCCVTSPVSHR